MAMLKYDEAIIDFNNAINLNSNVKDAYIKRADCYQKMAELEHDEEKKAEYINRAEADETRAKSMIENDDQNKH